MVKEDVRTKLRVRIVKCHVMYFSLFICIMV